MNLYFLFRQGHLYLNQSKIWGFENLDTSITNFYASKGKNESYAKTVIKLPISNFGVSTNYDVDIAILNKIPIYGKGEFR